MNHCCTKKDAKNHTAMNPCNASLRVLRGKLHPSEQGIALVIMLAMLVILLGLAITFLSRVRVDRASSASFAASTTTRQLADTAVNLVQGQIRDASTLDSSVAWTSQPGMIRTFASGAAPNLTASDSLYRVYKLYSASELISTAYTAGTDAPPATWADDHATWSDLNAPAPGLDGTLIYPILDPGAEGSVEGFDITASAPVASGSGANPAPMPVRWLYQLQDGSLVAASGNGTTATVAGADPKTNPIVGRIAFWTDDETCKVNINTASEGTYWDTPRLSSNQDRAFANYQPAQKEFQRYPGHPAMTSLAPVFFASNSTSTPALSPEQRDALYSVTPRIVGGGSDAGTVIATGSSTPDSDRLYASVDELMFAMPTGTGARPDQDSIAITADKVRQRAFFLTANSRAPEVNLFNTPRVAMWPVYKLNNDGTPDPSRTTAYDRLIAFCSTIGDQPYFFQRQSAKSPTNDWDTIEDNRDLLRYLQALSGKAIPGFGASMVSKTTADDRDQLLVEMLDYIRSTNLHDDNLSPNTYATQAAADNAVQFTSGRQPVADAYAWSGHGVVAPLRVPAGLADGAASNDSTLMGFGRYATISEAGLLFICNADGKNGTFKEPLDDDGNPIPLPMAAAPAPQQLARMMSNVAPGTPQADREFNWQLDQSNPGTDRTLPPTVTVSSGNIIYAENQMLSAPLASNQRRIQMMLFFDYFSPMQGWTQFGWDGSLDVEVTGSFQIAGNPVSFATPVETVNFDGPPGSWGFVRAGGDFGYRRAFNTSSGARLAPGETGTGDLVLRRYGLVTAPFTVTVPPSGTMTFQGPTKLLVKFYSRPTTPASRARTSDDLVQTIELKFPDADFPIPILATYGTRTNPDASATGMEYWWALNFNGAFSTPPSPVPPGYTGHGRFYWNTASPYDYCGNLIRPSDTLRTLVPYHGDTRLVAGTHSVDAGVFQPSTFYFNQDRKDNYTDAFNYGWAPESSSASAPPQIQSYLTNWYHSFWALHFPPAGDRLVSGANYYRIAFPKFPGFAVSDTDRRSARAFQQFGDFDNGVATAADGPYINKPDEGNTRGLATGNIPYFDQAFRQDASGPTFFSPNRQVPGPGMFGSLPTQMRSGNQAFDSSSPAANANNTWRTLLLRPQTGHPGAANPPDHLWLDFFWMPVVEPYAISEPFSTAGKINMNYAIEPFDYIERKTAMAALLRSEKIPAIATSDAGSYKTSILPKTTRLDLNIEETLKQWDAKFANNEVFVSSSQLCDLHLVPQGQSVAGMPSFWTTHALTGDNSRERPYTNLLGRLTTKSNTYTVHYRVQALKQPPTATVGQWDETKGVVTGEYRGSTTIERYITPKDPDIPDYAEDYAANPNASLSDLGTFYKWRTLNTRQFAP